MWLRIFSWVGFPSDNGIFLDHKKMHADATKLLKSLYLDLDTNAYTITLALASSRWWRVAKALSVESRSTHHG